MRRNNCYLAMNKLELRGNNLHRLFPINVISLQFARMIKLMLFFIKIVKLGSRSGPGWVQVSSM